MHKNYYLFKNKNKPPKDEKQEKQFITFVKVITEMDIPVEDIKSRYHITEEFLFCGIFDVKTNALVAKEPNINKE